MSDRTYVKYRWKKFMGVPLNLMSPKSFNEKIQWLKLYDRNPKYTILVDKLEVKKYVSKILGERYIIPTLGVWSNTSEIDWDNLPNQFVLKVTHDSGGLVICKNKDLLDKEKAISKIKKSLKNDYYLQSREWPYKNVPRKIIAEKYMEDEYGELRDYKFFCFNGQAKYFKIDFGRSIEHHANYYDTNGILQPFGEENYPPQPDKCIPIPGNLNELFSLANKLAHDIGAPLVRIDFYVINSKIYFGEITFYPASGLGKITPVEWDEKLGTLIDLPTTR